MGVRLTLGGIHQSVIPKVTCQCSEIIMKSQNGTDKIRAKILLVRDGDVFAVCKGCGTEVKVPLQKKPEPRLIIRK